MADGQNLLDAWTILRHHDVLLYLVANTEQLRGVRACRSVRVRTVVLVISLVDEETAVSYFRETVIIIHFSEELYCPAEIHQIFLS